MTNLNHITIPADFRPSPVKIIHSTQNNQLSVVVMGYSGYPLKFFADNVLDLQQMAARYNAETYSILNQYGITVYEKQEKGGDL